MCIKRATSQVGLLVAVLLFSSLRAPAAPGQLILRGNNGGLILQMEGDSSDEWRFQTSGNLFTWRNGGALGAVFSGKNGSGALAPAGGFQNGNVFYRAVKTSDLFDRDVLRTVRLTFPVSNWSTQLTANYQTGANLVGSLEMDGATYFGVGVRYKGNTSYSMGGQKKSLNIEINFTNSTQRLRGYKTVNLNNAAADESILRETLYFAVMQHYAACPKSTWAKVYINGAYWGLYSFVQQENSDLVDEWFSSGDGDRWRAPNIGGGVGIGGGGGGGRPPGGGGGGGFTSGTSALTYLGANIASYKAAYELKSDNSTNAWERLIHATDVLNNTPTAQVREKVQEILAVDHWLWFLAVENLFADDDSYFNKGADYGFYYELETGLIHPIEHDGNEAFTAGDVQLSPVIGTGNNNRPVIDRLLGVPEFRQRYLAHMRTVMREFYNPSVFGQMVDEYSAMTVQAIVEDPKKNFTMSAYTNDVTGLKNFIRQRHSFLTNHVELRPLAPVIMSVNLPNLLPTASEIPFVTAAVRASGAEGIDSVWLHYRDKSYGRFTAVQMFDDGIHGDGSAGDEVYGGATERFPAGAKIHYYVEARSGNAAKAASFSPPRAERDTSSYRVGLQLANSSPVVINEFMADNKKTLADPQGDYNDWIELSNLTSQTIDLSGCYLTDDPKNPRKWAFPDGTTMAPNGFLLIWADEDGSGTSGLHTNFKLAAEGEQILLVDKDSKQNAVLDAVTYGVQETDRSSGRPAGHPSVFEVQTPTPGRPNN